MKSLVRIAATLALLGILAAVTWCSLAPSPDMVKVEWMPRLLGRWANENPTFRNFPAFAVLAVFFYLTGAAWSNSGRAAVAFFSAVASSVLAVVLEVAQLLLPARCFDPDDMAWSMAGALTGATLAWVVGAFLKAIPFIKTDTR